MSFPQPTDANPDATLQWGKSMVISWIIDAMSKELSEAYIYTPSARPLWMELEEKFGQWDNSRVFNLKKQITEMKQGNDTLASGEGRGPAGATTPPPPNKILVILYYVYI